MALQLVSYAPRRLVRYAPQRSRASYRRPYVRRPTYRRARAKALQPIRTICKKVRRSVEHGSIVKTVTPRSTNIVEVPFKLKSGWAIFRTPTPDGGHKLNFVSQFTEAKVYGRLSKTPGAVKAALTSAWGGDASIAVKLIWAARQTAQPVN